MEEYKEQRKMELLKMKQDKLRQLSELNKELSAITRQLDKIDKQSVVRSRSNRSMLGPIEEEDSTISEISEQALLP